MQRVLTVPGGVLLGLILAQQKSVVDKGSIESTRLRLRSALHIIDGDRLETNTPYKYRGIPGPENEAIKSVADSE